MRVRLVWPELAVLRSGMDLMTGSKDRADLWL